MWTSGISIPSVCFVYTLQEIHEVAADVMLSKIVLYLGYIDLCETK